MATAATQSPKHRDPEATKARIFAAAAAEFAERGLAGARVDAIAKRAQANKQLIYAYFGSKEELFSAVVGRQIEELTEEVEIDPERFALATATDAMPQLARMIEGGDPRAPQARARRRAAVVEIVRRAATASS